MILTRRAALGGVQLDGIHSGIIIRQTNSGASRQTTQYTSRMGDAGQRMTHQHWEDLEASVSFAIDVPKTNMALRRQIFEQVMAWASRKGWLTYNWMPDRRLYVDQVVYPGAGDLWQWTDEFTIGFQSHNVPFWQTVTPATATQTGTSGTVQITVGGNTESVLDATFVNSSGAVINTFSISANGNQITLSGLGLANGATLMIHHGTDGLLRIVAGSTSVYDKYTGADDLYVNPGATTVTFSAGGAGTLTVQNYGRYVT